MSFAFPVFVINACLDKMICSRTEQRDKEVFAMDIGRGVYARSKLSLSWVNLLYTIKFKRINKFRKVINYDANRKSRSGTYA
jgi:hypothetical protein